MKISAELFGDTIGVDGNLKNFFEKKQAQVLVTIKADDHKQRFEFILNAAEATRLRDRLDDCLNNKEMEKHGFEVV